MYLGARKQTHTNCCQLGKCSCIHSLCGIVTPVSMHKTNRTHAHGQLVADPVCARVQASCGTSRPKTTWSRSWPERRCPSWRRRSWSPCPARKTSRCPRPRPRSSTTPPAASGAAHTRLTCGRMNAYLARLPPLSQPLPSLPLPLFTGTLCETCLCLSEVRPHPSLRFVVALQKMLHSCVCSRQPTLTFATSSPASVSFVAGGPVHEI